MNTNPIAIIGAGPAGMSCALWLHNLGLQPLVLDAATETGGMVRSNYHPNDWLLGFDHVTGTDLAEHFDRHLKLRNIAVFTHTHCRGFLRQENTWQLSLQREGGDWSLRAAAVVLATGSTPRVPAFLADLQQICPQRVITTPTDKRLRNTLLGQRIAVLGGGDNAFENALALAGYNLQIDLFCRGKARARAEFQLAAKSHPRIQVVESYFPSEWAVTQESLTCIAAGKSYDLLVGLLGFEPNSGWLPQAGLAGVDLSESGHIQVDQHQQTTQAGIWAAGDVTATAYPSVATAIAQGAVAAKAIHNGLALLY